MTFDDLDFDDDVDFDDGFGEDVESELPEESSNRRFIIIAGVLGAITILTVICLIVYFAVLRPQQQAAVDEQVKQATEQEMEVAMIIEQTSTAAAETAAAALFTATPTKTSVPTETPIPTATEKPTSVVAVATGSAPTEEAINATATALQATANFNALMLEATLTAQLSATPTYTDPSALPDGGFADNVGLPALFGIAALLIVIIFLARRLRTA